MADKLFWKRAKFITCVAVLHVVFHCDIYTLARSHRIRYGNSMRYLDLKRTGRRWYGQRPSISSLLDLSVIEGRI